MENLEEESESSEESEGGSEFDEDASSFCEQESNSDEPLLTEEEVQELLDQLLEVESQAAEAQELLEEESLATLRDEVRVELALKLTGSELNEAVKEEIAVYVDIWKEKLDEFEDQSALLQERLDDSGVDLPKLFKWIEKQAPQGCTTEAWRKRTHWAGSAATEEATDVLRNAEKHLEVLRPVKRRHGKLFEEGASGFLEKKFSCASAGGPEKVEVPSEGWDSLEALLTEGGDTHKSHAFGSEAWASVYLAATPQQAALLDLPGADQVEEIVDLDKCKKDSSIAAALAYEKETGLTEAKLRRVREEDDIKKGRMMQRLIFKRKGARKVKNISYVGIAPDPEQSIGGATYEHTEEILTSSSFNQDHTCLQRSIQGSLTDSKKSNSLFNKDAMPMTVGIESKKNDHQSAQSDEVGLVNLENLRAVMPKEHSHMSRNKEVAEASHSRADNVVINVDSDDEEVLEEAKQPDGKAQPNSDGICSSGLIVTSWKGKGIKSMNAEDGSVEASKSLLLLNSAPLGTVTHDMEMGLDEKLICTICRKNLKLKEVRRHPLFEVSICEGCLDFYQSGPFSKDLNGFENECSWCANGGDVVMCDICEKVICKTCIKENFGGDEVERIVHESEEWLCFCCDPEPLNPFVECFRKATRKQSLKQAISSDDELLESRIERNEKRRKRLRRIMEDDELEESTKLKQAHEKERKERLKRLHESALASTSSYMQVNASLQECPINVARDVDEECILIPLGIAKFLKPHQIEGVRFMWDNCIESLKKLKSGDPGNGCILAHNMGLGKTLQVITFLYAVMREDLRLRTALIVTPLNVLHNWPDEFEQWRPSDVEPLKVYVLDDASRTEKKRQLSHWQKTGGVMMIGYTAFRTLSIGKHIKDAAIKEKISKALQDPGPDLLICDEAHMIKNKKADITQSLKQVKTQRRIALTGSPLQNNLMEYFCMVDFVRGGFLGRPQDFKNRFQNPIENGQHADSTEYDVRCMKERTHILHKQLSGFVQRKGAGVVQAELPPKFIYVISVRLSPLQRALYNRFIQKFWLPTEHDTLIAKSRKSLFTTYHTLAKVWNHPNLLFYAKEERNIESEDSADELIGDDDEGLSSEDGASNQKKEDKNSYQRSSKKKEMEGMNQINSLEWCQDLIADNQQGVLENSGKLVILLEILAMSSDREEKALVFSQSLPTLNLIEAFLERIPRPGGKKGCWRKDKEWYRLDGKTKAKERQRLVKLFNDPGNDIVQCVLISTRAGSLGINLQAANRVIILDGSWNPTHDMQALFRAWRYGQKKRVVVYRLLAYGTAEEKIYKRQVAKESLAARVLDEQQVGRHSKMEELKVLFKLDDDFADIQQSYAPDGVKKSNESPENHFTGMDFSDHNAPEDEIMTSLLIDHHPKWIVRIHQHETLLLDREDEKLTIEEQAIAWERFKRSMENSNVEWVQVTSDTAEHDSSSQVLNSWTSAVQSMPFVSACTVKFHAELLMNSRTRNNERTECEVCQQLIGWEHIRKRHRVAH